MTSGLFVAFEGGDGAGKSTQARALAQALRAEDHEVILTREPGGTPAAEAIRQVVLTPDFAGLDPRAETLLYAASRADHVARLISSIAYQGVGRGLGPDVVGEINLWATRHLLPDLTVLLDVDAGTGLARLDREPDRLEAEPEQFHSDVVAAFLALAAGDTDRYLVLPAAGDRDEIAAAVKKRVDELIALRGTP